MRNRSRLGTARALSVGASLPARTMRPCRHSIGWWPTLAIALLFMGFTTHCGGGGGGSGGGGNDGGDSGGDRDGTNPHLPPGNLIVTIIGLGSLDADVTVTGPDNYSQHLTSTKNLTDLAAGTYTVTAATVTDTTLPGLGRGNNGTLGPANLQRYPLKVVQFPSVASGGASAISVAYPAPTLTVQIPAGNGTVPIDFVLVPPGSYTMGSTQFGFLPLHAVTIGEAFYLAKTPTTQGQWKAVMGTNPSYFSMAGEGKTASDDLTRPVEMVSWDNIRNANTGFLDRLNAALPSYGFRLPSEAEYEYACRAGTTTAYFFGDDIGLEGATLSLYEWWNRNSSGTTHSVAALAPNPWGLYDIVGNVLEWTEDDWHGTSTGAPSDGSIWIGNPRGTTRVDRGAGWTGDYFGNFYRSSYRQSINPDQRVNVQGFRVALPASGMH